MNTKLDRGPWKGPVHVRLEEKGMTEHEMVGWHHQLNGHEFDQTPGDSEGWVPGAGDMTFVTSGMSFAGSRQMRKPGVLQFMGSQRVRHDWVTEQQQMRYSEA